MTGDRNQSRVDVTRPSVPRIYDFLLDGKDNFEVDRAAAQEILKADPRAAEAARSNRDFLGRVVRYLAGEAGVRQFLDIGSGLPTAENVHEVAQRIDPDARVVYVDNDATACSHGRALMKKAHYVEADLRDPGKILAEASEVLDFAQPVAVMFLAILHFIPDEDRPAAIVRHFMDAMPPGSYLAVSHVTAPPGSEERAEAVRKAYEPSPAGGVYPRDPDDIGGFLGYRDRDLVPPGLVDITAWRPAERVALNPAETIFYGGVACKTA